MSQRINQPRRLAPLTIALLLCNAVSSNLSWADAPEPNNNTSSNTTSKINSDTTNSSNNNRVSANNDANYNNTNSTVATQQLQTIRLQAQEANAPDRDLSAIAKTIIPRAEMLQYGDQTVSDSLRRAAGIVLPTPGSGPRGGGGAGAARFRGGAPTFLINGEAVQGGPRGGLSVIDTLSIDMIERIEVTKQPSVAQASVASSAVINIILKQPLEDKVSSTLRVGYGVREAGQQRQKQSQLSAQIESKTGPWAWSVNAQQMQNDSENLSITQNAMGETARLQRFERSMRMFSPRLEYQIDDSQKLAVDAFIRDQQTDGMQSDTIQKDRNRGVRLNSRYERIEGDNTDKLRVSLEQLREQQDTRSSSLSNILNNISREDLNEYGLAYDGLRLLQDDLQAKFGLDVRLAQLTSSDAADLDERRAALYTEGSWRFLPQHTATFGLRQEFLQRSGLVKYQDQHLSPVLAYHYDYDDAWSLQSNLSQAFKSPKTDLINPTISISTEADAGGINNPDRAGNPNLKPEIVRAFESTLGFNRANGGFNVTGFYRDTQDFIERVIALEGTRFVERPQNQSSASSYGVELSGRYALKQNSAGHSVMLNGQLATIRAKIDSDNSERLASDVAPYSAGAGISYNFQPWQLATSVQWNYSPAYARTLDDQPFIRTMNARSNVDVNLSKRWQQGWSLALNIRNILAVTQRQTLVNVADGSLFEARSNDSAASYLLTLSKQF